MTTIANIRNPGWWGTDIESAWNRVKDVVKRDWGQPPDDFGASCKPDFESTMDDSVREAQGWDTMAAPEEPNCDEIELAFRFGYGAHVQFGGNYTYWDKDLAEFLREEWEKLPANQRRTWMEDRSTIRYGWEFEP